METGNGTRLVLKNVKHIPDIRFNFISVGRLVDEGFCNTFYGDVWKLTKGAMVVARGKKCETLYLMRANLVKDRINVVEDEDTIELWHQRLSHISEKGLAVLAKKGLLSGVKGTHLKRRAHCLTGKQNRVSFKNSSSSKKPNVLDLVHSDVCGLMKTRSLGGAFYFVTFMDDHSRKISIYTLKTKDQVLDVFNSSKL